MALHQTYTYLKCALRVTHNVSTINGLANGMIVSFQKLHLKPNAQPTYEKHDLYGTYPCYEVTDVDYIIVKLELSHLRDKFIIPSFDRGTVPLFPFPGTKRCKNGLERVFTEHTRKFTRRLGETSFTFTMQQFPIYPAWVGTGHTMQGRTLEYANITEIHKSVSWLYVVLSRASTRGGISLKEPIDYDIYKRHKPNRNLEKLHTKLLSYHSHTMKHFGLESSPFAVSAIMTIKENERIFENQRQHTHNDLKRGDETFLEFTKHHSHDMATNIFYFALVRSLQSDVSAKWITNLNKLLRKTEYKILSKKRFTFSNMAYI